MKTIRTLFIGFLVCYIGINLFYLDKYPLIWWDDVHSTELSWSLIKYGDFSSRLCNPDFGFEKTHVVYGRLYSTANAVSIKLLGLGPFQARLFPFISGLLLLFFVFKISKRILSEKTALLSVFLLSLSYIFIVRSHMARPDIVVSMFIFMTIYLFLVSFEKQSAPLFLLTGFVSALTVDIHPPGVVAIFALFTLLLLHFKKISKLNVLLALTGIGLGGVWWLLWHVAPDTATFFYQWKNYWLWEKPPLAEKNVFIMIANETKRYYSFFWEGRFHRNLILAVPILISFVHLSIKSNPGRKLLLLTLAGCLFCFTFVVPSKTDFYLIFIFPFFIILASESILTFIEQSNKHLKYLGFISLTAILFLISVEDIYILKNFRQADYKGFIKQLKNYIPDDGQPVMGQPTYWFGFIKDRQYFTDYFGYYRYYNPKEDMVIQSRTFTDVVRKNKVKYIIVDDGFFYWNQGQLKSNIKPFLKTNCELTGTIEDRYFGPGYFAFLKQSKCITKIYEVQSYK